MRVLGNGNVINNMEWMNNYFYAHRCNRWTFFGNIPSNWLTMMSSCDSVMQVFTMSSWYFGFPIPCRRRSNIKLTKYCFSIFCLSGVRLSMDHTFIIGYPLHALRRNTVRLECEHCKSYEYYEDWRHVVIVMIIFPWIWNIQFEDPGELWAVCDKTTTSTKCNNNIKQEKFHCCRNDITSSSFDFYHSFQFTHTNDT